jgi:predicted transcriptional regulator with HTH domain
MRGTAGNTIKKLGYDLYFSLERSGVKREVLRYLRRYPSGVPIADISRNIETSYANTKGAILGNGRGYKIDTSLASMGLVTFNKARGSLVLYSLTPKGAEIAGLLEERP